MFDWLPDHLSFVLGLVALLISAELLVRNAVKLSDVIGRSSLFVGLTVAAIGTSAPELAVGTIGVLSQQADIGLGNIVGSNVFNIFVVLGLAALVRPLVIARPVIQRDIPILLFTCLLFFVLVLDGSLSASESLLLLLLLLGYLAYLSRTLSERGDATKLETTRERSSGPRRSLVWTLVIIAASSVLMMIASHWMVTGAVGIAGRFGISELTIGLTIVAVGTSLPEIATTLAAVRGNHHELAVGNVLGSCMFNIVAVPAVMAILHPSALPVADAAISVDLPIMIVAVVACLPIFLTGHVVSRLEGLLFLVYYLAYGLILYYRSSSESSSSDYRTELALLALPVLVITVTTISVRLLRPRYKNKKGVGM